jgi:alpha-D-ribose 1-methylphosphonate 5-triphosphate synthase subunit PhnH
METKLASIAPGFSDIATSSQSLFRASLSALSRPGRIVRIDDAVDIAAPGHKAAGALLLALLDQDTTLWLSPTLRESSCASFLRFHTGCELTDDHSEADFAWVNDERELPVLASLRQGSDEYPDRSCTLLLQVSRLDSDRQWRISGPGIDGESYFGADLSEEFIAQRIAMQKSFPRGIDLLLSHGDALMGLPRSTRIGH